MPTSGKSALKFFYFKKYQESIKKLDYFGLVALAKYLLLLLVDLVK